MKIYFIATFLILYLKFGHCENLKLLILHNNDMHSRFEETSRTSGTCKDKANCYGGFARVLHVIREARKAAADGTGPPVLYLNAGDTYTGTSWFSVHKWKIAADFLNLLHPDVACFGNHEFAYKPSGLAPFLNTITFPIIAANIDFSQEYQLKSFDITKSWVFNVNGKKIGVIGYTTPSTMFTAYTQNVMFGDEIAAIKSESEALRSVGVKTIIALGHSGFQMDMVIAREVPLVDLVIGGHTNTFLWNGPLYEWPETPEAPYPTIIQQPNGKRIPVVQAYAYTKYIGRLTIIINDEGQVISFTGLPQLLNSTVPQDSDALNLLEKYRPKLLQLDAEVVGHIASTLTGEIRSCRYHECTLANLITDAFVAYNKKELNLSTIGMISAKTLYHDVTPNSNGSISMLDLLNSLPYGGKVYTVSLRGIDIWNTLEIGVSKNPKGTGAEFIHTSGIQYVFDASRPAGSRILQLKVRCDNCVRPTYENLIFEETYRLTVSEFLFKGLDFQTIIKENGFDVVVESKSELEIIVWYFNQEPLVNKTIEGRIISIS